jgi:hypothetical protein
VNGERFQLRYDALSRWRCDGYSLWRNSRLECKLYVLLMMAENRWHRDMMPAAWVRRYWDKFTLDIVPKKGMDVTGIRGISLFYSWCHNLLYVERNCDGTEGELW